MDISNGFSSTSGGSNNIMTHKKKKRLTAGQKKDIEREKKKKRSSRRREERKEERGGKTAGERKDERRGIEPSRKKPEPETIQLQPKQGLQAPDEQGVIDLTQQGQPEEVTTRDKVVSVAKAAGIGVAVGTGAFLIGGAIAGTGAGAAILRGGERILSSVNSKLFTHKPAPSISPFARKIAATSRFGFSRVGNNAKNFVLKKTYLQKLASTAKDPKVILGILASTVFTSLFWAPNEKGDALTTLTIAQGTALRNGDFESVIEIDEIIQETLDISASIPVIGFLKSELAKFGAAAKASEVSVKEAEKLRDEQIQLSETGETEFARERRESDEAAVERKKVEEERQDIRFKDIQEKGEERILDEEARQDKRFKKIQEDRDARELKEEEEETAKFAKIEEDRKLRKEEDRKEAAEDNLFFEGIRNRNKGRPLTEEQKRVLRKRGASIT